MLSIKEFFDFEKYPFEHEKLFMRDGISNVVDVLGQIGPYCQEWLDAVPLNSAENDCRVEHNNWPNCISSGNFTVIVEPSAEFFPDRIISDGEQGFIYVSDNAKVIGGTFDLTGGSVFIGEKSEIQGAWICGPVIIGKKNTVRPGAYIRENVIIGNNCTIRGELKNTVVMNECDFPHPSYLGDSICGYKTHFGNQATAANVNIFGGKNSIKIKIDGEKFDTGRRKIGIIMGDKSQVGCNSVSDPGTFLKPGTIVYSLSRINSGIYGPNEILKNKPLEHGVIERVKRLIVNS